MRSGLPVVTSPLLELPGVRHAFFTRQGGVSGGIYQSLNVGLGSADAPDDVAENRRRCAAHFDLPADALRTVYQVHSATVVTAESLTGEPRPQADALTAQRPGVICGALAADCAPILLCEPEARIVAAVHAGWKGALGGVAEAAVAAMVARGARPHRIVAAVGPCIGPASYEVGLEFLAAFETADAPNSRFFTPGVAADKRLFDLPAFVLSRLRAVGVETCDWVGCDTSADETRFFSNRRAFRRGEPDFGRLLSAIVLV